MKQDLTKAEYAVLGLLVEKPAHGWDLEQVIEQRNMRDWTELAFSSIYYVLKRLEKHDFVEVLPTEKTGKGTRKVYAPTDTGRSLHAETTLKFLGEPENLYPALLSGLANWMAVDRDKALHMLRKRKTALLEVQADLETKSKTEPVFVGLMFDYSLAHLNAELDWIETALTRLGGSS
jgi:DNA-binding PadR family transcriptional regulator